MFKKSLFVAATLVLPTLVACGVVPVAPSSISARPAALQAASFGSSAVIHDTHLGGSRFASFKVTVANPTYGTQAIVHRWVASDIAYYVLTLDDLTNDKTGIAQVQVSPSQQGVFAQLQVNTLYKVTVQAYSYVQSDGTTGSTAHVINSNDQWNSSEFSFTSGDSSNNNIDNQITYSSSNFYNALTVHLDNSAFDGTAAVSTTPGSGLTVYDGSYTGPSQPITATATGGTSCTDGRGNDQCQGQGS